MRRREFVAACAAALASSLACAQPIRRPAPFRIVTYPDMIPSFRQTLFDAFRDAGWTEATDFVVVESGLRHNSPELAMRAKAIVDSKPDLLLTYSSNHALTLHRATRTIPIVMWTSGYPVEVGIADSLSRPGKNVTGNTHYAGTGLWGKLLQLLKELAPEVKRVGVYWGYVPPEFPKAEIEPCYRELRAAARRLGMAIDIKEVATEDQVPAALSGIDAGKPDALLVTTSPALWEARGRVMEFAARRRLPTIADVLWPVTDASNPLLMYAPSPADLIRRAVSYVVRIRNGAKPGELPIQLPSKFELVVNRRTAQAIGLAIPKSILLRADQVIE